jgi:hypothetical protein
MKKRGIEVVLSLIMFFFANHALSQGECPGQHCSAKAPIVNIMCKNLGNAGGVVFVEHNNTYCWCKCSCLASNTPVKLSDGKWKRIGEITKNDSVLAMNSDGKWKKAQVVYSDGTTMPEQPYPYAIYVALEDSRQLVVTADHLFWINGKLKRADRLAPNDKLTNSDGKAVGIKTVVSGSYHGPIHHIAATSWDESTPTVDGHLIDTQGVVSGDYFAELYLSGQTNLKTPQIGTAEYNNSYMRSFSKIISAEDLPDVIELEGDSTFQPAKRFVPPKDAIPFLPDGYDEAKPGMLGPLDHTLPYEMAVYLVNHFKVYYPDVTYHIEWGDNTVNAYAWKQGSTRHVAILGGLLRHVYVKQEGAGLVLAHELGHHYGGEPRYPNNPWASCEGQSDYWGALIGMRKVWFGHYAMEQIDEGSTQLRNLFMYGLTGGNLFDVVLPEPKPGSLMAGCSHPPAQCRYDTYKAAMRLDDKPSCAVLKQ